MGVKQKAQLFQSKRLIRPKGTATRPEPTQATGGQGQSNNQESQRGLTVRESEKVQKTSILHRKWCVQCLSHFLKRKLLSLHRIWSFCGFNCRAVLNSAERENESESVDTLMEQSCYLFSITTGLPCSSDSKDSACNAGDLDSIPRLGRSPGGGHGNPLQYSCLENPHRQEEAGGLQSMGSQSQTQLIN